MQLICDSGTFSFLAEEPTEHLHLAIGVPDHETVHGFHRAALAAGGRDNGGRGGERVDTHSGYYVAFALDPDFNTIEAVHHESSTPDTGVIDHLWIRVRDLDATKRFYTAIAPAVGTQPANARAGCS